MEREHVNEHVEAARRSLIVASDELTSALDAGESETVWPKWCRSELINAKRQVANLEEWLGSLLNAANRNSTQGGD